VVRIGGAVAALGVLLSLIAGVSRTAFAMAADRALPPVARRRPPHPRGAAPGGARRRRTGRPAGRRHRPPWGHRLQLLLRPHVLRDHHASAWTLPAEHRRWPRALAVGGVVGCVALAFTLPPASVRDRHRRPVPRRADLAGRGRPR
jgi:APA family basic amino acid/polyamine antiporter